MLSAKEPMGKIMDKTATLLSVLQYNKGDHDCLAV
jgi:hypothetical protein